MHFRLGNEVMKAHGAFNFFFFQKQIRTPELEHARQESLRAKADKLQSQLHYMKVSLHKELEMS